MRAILSTILFLIAQYSFAQLNEQFTDGDFTNNPTWSGDDSVYVVSTQGGNFMLRSNKTSVNSSFYLSTPNTIASDCQWEFYANLQFNTSGANYVDVYLTSDNANLLAAGLNGYFVRIGTTQDEISLYKNVAGVSTKIIDGTDGTTNFSNNSMKIKVIRTAANDWTLSRDMSGVGSSFTIEGSVNDASLMGSNFFGVAVTQSTASFFQKHFFDDFYIGSIVLDTTPPVIVSSTVLSNTAVDVLFSEALNQTTAEALLNYSINNGITIASATLDGSNPALVHLVLSNALINNTTYTLTVNGIQDIAANTIVANSTSTFSIIVAGVAQFGDIIINEIYTDQTPLVGLPDKECVEIYNRSASSFNIGGWKISDPGTNGTIGNRTILPGQYIILCANADTAAFASFGVVVGVSSWPSLNNAGDKIYLRTNLGVAIDSVNYSDTWYQDEVKKIGGWSLELINPNIASNCAGGGNWIASNHPAGGTLGQINSVFNGTPDVTAPSIVSTDTPNPTTLNLCFNEPINPQFIVPANFSINNGIGNPMSIASNGNCVVLTLNNPLVQNTNYTITCNNLSDCSGNALNPNTFNFIYFLPGLFDVVINEIMADPSPQVGLPNAEYVELFNRTSYAINTTGWTFTHGTTVRNLPNAILPADSFLVLTTASALADMSIYGNVVSVPSLSTTAITNSGTTLSIKDNNGQLIHSVTYSDQWYNDPVKFDGGWSLELIDPNNPCAAGTNWTASNNPDGGTPGKKNSVFGSNPDITAPALGSVRIINSNQLELELTETIINQSAITAAMFSIDNGVGSPAQISFVGPFSNKLIISLSNALQQNLIYTLTFNGVLQDCAGNSSVTGISVVFANYTAKAFDVVINEVMADPDPVVGLPNFEFIELHNRTPYPINIANWKIKYGTTSKNLPSATLNPSEYVILCAQNAASSLQSYGKTIIVPGLSSSAFTNTGTMLVLADTSNRIIHAVEYSDTWYGNSAKATGGYSLEQIDILNPCGGQTNWIASNSAIGGTPGALNSVAASNSDTKAPLINGICIQTTNTLIVKFNEAQDSSSIFNTGTYIVDNLIGAPSSVQLSGPLYKQVLLTFNSNFNLSTVYTLTIAGTVKDCAGNAMQAQTTEKFSLYAAQPYEVVINEIMADESPAVGLPAKEYIELYNKTNNPISLNGFSIKTGSSNTVFGCTTIKPNDYLTVLQKAALPDESIYGRAYVAENYSSLTNSGSEITLSSGTGSIISTVTFSDTWYNNTAKKDGGWSLEQKDPNNPCAGASNWSACADGVGGTPGKLNSINAANADTKAPEINRIAFLSASSIVVYFSEPLKAATLFDVSSYSIDNGIGNPAIVVPYLPDYKKMGLILQTPIQSGTIYTLTITGNVRDCADNLINTTITGRFSIPEKIQVGDIVLNELLFNPKTDGYDFAEFYNKSNKVLSLNKVKIANVDTVSKLASSMSNIDTLGYLIFPSEYYVVSANSEVVQKQYLRANGKNFISVSSMPSMSVGSGSFGFVLNNDTILDALMYTESMHYPLIKDKKGVSLERISFNRPTSDLSNWHSAAEQVGYATPGYQNSQFLEDKEAEDILSFTYEIFSPDNDGYNDVLVANYLMSAPGFVANAWVYDARGRMIKKIVENELLGTSGSFSWDGLTESNEKGSIGVYTLYFEYFDTTGNTFKLRKSFVLAGKL